MDNDIDMAQEAVLLGEVQGDIEAEEASIPAALANPSVTPVIATGSTARSALSETPEAARYGSVSWAEQVELSERPTRRTRRGRRSRRKSTAAMAATPSDATMPSPNLQVTVGTTNKVVERRVAVPPPPRRVAMTVVGMRAPSLRGCPVPDCGGRETEAHAFEAHLPHIFLASLSGRDVVSRRTGALKFLISSLMGARATLAQLVRYGEALGFPEGNEEVSSQLALAMKEFGALFGQSEGPFQVLAHDNGPQALLHWRFLLRVAALLEKSQLLQWRDLFPLSEEERAAHLPRLPEGFDAHFHLDRTSLRLGLKGLSLRQVVQGKDKDSMYPFTLTGGTAVFCDPDTWPEPEELPALREMGLVLAVGLHPKKVASSEQFRRLGTLLSSPDVSAVGEVGIDHTVPPGEWVGQRLRLEKVLKLLTPAKILVLHCRGLPGGEDDALFSLLMHLQCIPVGRDQLIHLHLFQGSMGVLRRWLQAYPNTYFGVGSRADSLPGRRVAVAELHRSRVLLETDSPHFPCKPNRHGTPADLGWTGAIIAPIWGCTWQEVLAITARNARRLYVDGLPPESTGQ
ncbi:uncharacterized protein LOC106175328 [Lingula anatina]|uniref:Uncharacterized protein LOC106175328 n=1 Tax=Lingula anatina TaxID=7574 RepID=A0A1S3JQQ5_LINAN|nr:uncharacterized protein LOC106175328 [Lingula anatina]|eukprot:XP_013412723.1 uncharacterized protein LOC106175328 [Lingula anatina]